MTRTRSRSREEEHKSTMSNLVKALNESLNDTRFRRLAGVLLLFIVTPYLIVAFSSYIFTWRSDMSIVKEQGLSLLFQSKEEVVNWLGRFGAVISHLFIYNWFGITSYFFVLIFFLTGFKLMFGISLLPVKRSLKHSFFFLVWLSITLGYIFKIISISEEARHLMGGAFGIRCDLWLQGLLGSIGTGFLLVFVFIVYLIVSFDVSFNWFNTKGVTVPIKEASITTANKDRDTVMDNIISPLSINIEHPKANIAAISALINATTNTF